MSWLSIKTFSWRYNGNDKLKLFFVISSILTKAKFFDLFALDLKYSQIFSIFFFRQEIIGLDASNFIFSIYEKYSFFSFL